MGKWITFLRSAQKHNTQNFKHNWLRPTSIPCMEISEEKYDSNK